MDDPVTALGAQQDELAGYVAEATESDLLLPSRCDGWTVADVLLHLAQTNEMAVASVEGRLDAYVGAVASEIPQTGSIDDWAGALVDLQRTDPTAARDRWLVSAGAQHAAFAGCDPDARVPWVVGELAARTLTTTRLTESWIHTVDVAVAFGDPPPPTDRLWHTSRLTWRTVPYALGQEGLVPAGPVVFSLDAPDGSTWTFGEPAEAATTITGTAVDLCTVAGQRGAAAGTSLHGEGPDAHDVLRLMRTFA
ncbi:MAG: wyosine base formation [Ilumatobacteraceae bacterium]|nr:wyosine base formation [Ilumatobacteraceae bacterium]